MLDTLAFRDLRLSRLGKRSGQFNPATLFAAGEQGILADPSDLSTLFTDTAGTTPVTAPGQTVARLNDKSGRGNHLTQSVAAARPIYGRHPASGIRNRLAASEQFDSAAWVKASVTVSANASIAPDGTTTADKVVATNTASTTRAVYQSFTAPTTATYTVSFYAKAAEYSLFAVQEIISGRFGASFDLSAQTTATLGGAGFLSSSITSVGDGWFRCAVVWNGVASTGYAITAIGYPAGATVSAAGAAYAGNGTSGIFIWGAQLELGSTATAYQRVGAPSGLAFPRPQSYDITEAGQPSLHYLFCDGLARWMQSPTITPGTDKAQVFAGVRKLSDAAGAIVLEHSVDVNTSNGALYFLYPRSGTLNEPLFASKGTIAQLAGNGATTFTAPRSDVLTCLADISAPFATQRVNGVQRVSTSASQGTGNFLAHQMYIGSRGGTLIFFNGLIYSIIVRFGPNLPLATIQQAERWTAQRTGLTLP
jgi:hypothetical protein